MILPSRLSTTTLGDLLGKLSRQRTTGTLELVELWAPPGARSPRHEIHLFCGHVSGVDSAFDAPPLGELLRSEGFLGDRAFRTLLRRIGEGDPRPSGEILVAERMADAETVEAALRVQLRLKLDALFSLGDAAISFHTAKPNKVSLARRVHPLEPRDFLLGRPRARDRIPTSEVRPRSRPAYVYPGEPAASCGSVPPSSSASSSRGSSRGEPPRSAPREEPTSGVSVISDKRRAALAKLGLSANAGEEEIRKAFRKLAIELHPDKHVKASATERDKRAAKFAEVSAAYHALVA